MTTPRAEDLPIGSIVANEHTAWIKTSVGDPANHPDGTWNGTGDGLSTYDWEPQDALDGGAKVLRVGDGNQP